MTFYVKALFFNATEAAWSAIQADKAVRQNLYKLSGEIDHAWYHPSHQHNYSDLSLFVVRPICSPGASGESWLCVEDNVANPEDFILQDEIMLDVDPLKVQPNTCLSLEGFQMGIPSSILQYAKVLCKIIKSHVVYYDVCYWGGMIEYELAWVFGDQEEVCVQLAETKKQDMMKRITATSETTLKGEVLQYSLAKLGVKMSSGFFLPHTRSFDWAPNQVR